MRRIVSGLLVLLAACSGSKGPPANVVRMEFERAAFYDAPVPDESLRRADGTIDVAGMPGVEIMPLATQLRDLIAGSARGFARSSTVYFQLTAAPGPLPTPTETLAATAVVQLVDVDDTSPELGRRIPLRAHFLADGGPLGAPNMLALTPYQGVPLRPSTLYAAVVLRSLDDADGRALGQSAALVSLVRGQKPAGMSSAAFTAHQQALTKLAAGGVSTRELAGLAVFRTDDYQPQIEAVLADALARPTFDAPFVADEIFPTYCVFHTTVQMPVYQAGVPPYASEGGQWTFDANGAPVLDHMETAKVVVTLPRTTMPAGGFPTMVFSRTGAGGDRPLVDRGPQAVAHGPSIGPGLGFARDFAMAGFAGISIDGPLGGLRNPDGTDEQFAIFNVGNPGAIRDNVRQSAVELALAAHLVDAVSVDASGCGGLVAPASTAALDGNAVGLFGHSMGATIAPLAAAIEPRFGAVVLSGSGGSWIENILYKQQPLNVRPLAEVMIGYSGLGRTLEYGDPAMMMFQWAVESADPPLYARPFVEGRGAATPRHVLMVQGIVDHYILPPIANCTSLSLGLDLGAPELDTGVAEIAAFDTFSDITAYSGRSVVTLPRSGNYMRTGSSAATAVVVQHAEDGIEDGHEVLFQLPEARYQVRCFLATWRTSGVPVVPVGSAADVVCP